MAKEIKTQITIQAPASVIWNILMDFPAYAEWNPFLKELSGKAKVGERLTAFIQPAGSKGMTFKPVVQIAEMNKHFQWKGSLFIPGLFDGVHEFIIHENADGSCEFIHQEHFKGILTFLFNPTNSKLGFEAMNQQLKRRAEQAAKKFERG